VSAPAGTTTVQVNGGARELASGTTLDAVVASVSGAGTGIAVALNDDVVPRTQWAQTVLGEHDRVEILTAVQGG
jgi:sulfur carrier protein